MLVAALVSCGGEDAGTAPQPIEYYQSSASAGLGAAANQASCATCHSNDGSARSGNSLRDIAYHSAFKGGDAPTLLDGVNACVTGWMGGTALTAGDERYLALEGYLKSISSQSNTTPNTIAPEVLADEGAYGAAYAGGDAAAGAAKYSARCGTCHDAGLTVGPRQALPKASLAGYSVGRIAQKVRTSGPPPSGSADASDSTPGPMPFFELSDLSATDLKDIIAHLKGQ